MGKKRIHVKPSGDLGTVRVTNNGSTPIVEWRKFDFPQEKKDQEFFLAGLFVPALNTATGAQWTFRQLHENDFDLELVCAEEKRYLELQELTIPPRELAPDF